MSAAQDVRGEPISNLNSSPTPKSSRLLLPFLFLAFVLSSLFLIYLLKNPNLNFNTIIKNPPTAKNKIEISQKELDEAYQLEKMIRPVDLTLASPSAQTTANESALRDLARERVTKRKILEQEAKGLGVNLEDLKTKSSGFTPAIKGIEFYDNLLRDEVRVKVEGQAQLLIVSLSLNSLKGGQVATASAQKVQEFLKQPSVKTADRVLSGLELGKDINVSPYVQTASLFFGPGDSANPLSKFVRESKVGDVTSFASPPHNLQFVKLLERTGGLGMSFETWYGKVKNNYYE